MSKTGAPVGIGSMELLGPLPSASWMLWCHNAYEAPYYSSQDGYTDDDMRAYAMQELVAERERCARIVETLRLCQRGDCDDLAARIRGV